MEIDLWYITKEYNTTLYYLTDVSRAGQAMWSKSQEKAVEFLDNNTALTFLVKYLGPRDDVNLTRRTKAMRLQPQTF